MTDTEIIQIFSDKRGKINPNRTRTMWLDKNPQVKAYLENRYSVFFDYTTTLQFIFNNLDEPPKCEKCGKHLNSIRRWCDQNCQLTDPKFIEQRELAIDYDAKVKKTKNTMLERYGVSSGFGTKLCKHNSHTKEARQKAVKSSKQTCLAKYGVENSLQVEEIKQKALKTKLAHRPNDPNNSKKIRQTMKDRYGGTATMSCPSLKKEVFDTKQDKYGDPYYTNIEKSNQTLMDKYGENPTRFGSNGFKRTMKEKYGVEYYSQTEYFKNARYKKYFYDNIFFDSSWELCYYKYQKDHNVPIEVEPVRIEYYVNNKKHYYLPDFRINSTTLVEIKGGQFFENGKMINPFDRSLDYLAEAKYQCMIDNNVDIILDCQAYLEYCGKDFIKAHEVIKELDLDYLEWKKLSSGRQTCINIAKKANWRELYTREIQLWNSSSKIRFDLIKNRNKYLEKTEDELTNLEIIRGLNISGKITAYSTFNNSGLVELLDKYHIQSVYDPCAGWGERLVTCAAKNIKYLGTDINKNVIKGHQQIIANYNLTDQSTRYGDSFYVQNDTKSDLVFVCPPYFSQEIYTDVGAENLDYDSFLIWWDRLIQNCINNYTKYFAFQINQKNKSPLYDIVIKHNLKHIESIVIHNNVSHFNKTNKKDFESIEIFEVN
jgi:hypothetical protein